LVAVKGYATFYTLHSGQIKVETDGSNTWSDVASNNQSYLVEQVSPQAVQTVINKLIMHQPVKTK